MDHDGDGDGGGYDGGGAAGGSSGTVALGKNDWEMLWAALSDLELDPTAKRVMRVRIDRIYGHLDRNYKQSRYHYFASKSFVVVVGIVDPALLSITTHTQSVTYTIIFWCVWGLQLLVGIVTALITLFKWDKRYFVYMLYRTRLEHEVWTYISLTGRYALINPHNEYEAKHMRTTHASKCKRFMYHLESLHRRLVEYDVELESAEDVSTIDGGDGNHDAVEQARSKALDTQIADLRARVTSETDAQQRKHLSRQLATLERIREKNLMCSSSGVGVGGEAGGGGARTAKRALRKAPAESPALMMHRAPPPSSAATPAAAASSPSAPTMSSPDEAGLLRKDD